MMFIMALRGATTALAVLPIAAQRPQRQGHRAALCWRGAATAGTGHGGEEVQGADPRGMELGGVVTGWVDSWD